MKEQEIREIKKYSEKYPLEDYLYKEKREIFNQSRENLDLLFRVDNSKVISFIGAGVAKPLGIPDWEDLMKDLLRYARERFSENSLPSALPENAEKWPELAQQIYDRFKSSVDTQEFFSYIAGKMSPPYNTTTITLVKLILAINVHLTTNFDPSIDNAYRFLDFLGAHFKDTKVAKKYEVRYLPNFKPYQSENSKALIYYLHCGGGKDNRSYVLTKEDYDLFYPSISGLDKPSALEECFQYYYDWPWTIIFIGVSFQDTYVKKLCYRLAKNIEIKNKQGEVFYTQSGNCYSPKTPNHFWIVDSNMIEEGDFSIDILESFKNEYYICPIIYKKEQHKFLEYIFEQLLERM